MPLLTLHDGRRLRYREGGARRGGVPIVLVHGAGASSAVWLLVLHRLARTRRVVAVDLPGHGRSAGAASSIDQMAEAVGLVAGTLCLGPSVIAGHSMGGLVALTCALRWPDKVAGVALVASSARLGVGEPFLEVLRRDWARWPEYQAEGAYSMERPREWRRRAAGLSCAASHEQTLADYAAIRATDLRDRLAELAARGLGATVVTGAHDVIVAPKHSAATAAALGARHTVVERAGHMLPQECPEVVAAELAALGLAG